MLSPIMLVYGRPRQCFCRVLYKSSFQHSEVSHMWIQNLWCRFFNILKFLIYRGNILKLHIHIRRRFTKSSFQHSEAKYTCVDLRRRLTGEGYSKIGVGRGTVSLFCAQLTHFETCKSISTHTVAK